MTDTGWNWILHEITVMKIELPDEPMIAIEAAKWMDGYLKCQTDILEMLERMSKGQRDG